MRFVRRQNQRIARATATLLAGALCAAPLLETAHEARVLHVACPEDGELIDAPAQARHDHAYEAAKGPQLFREQGPAAPAGTGRAHEHCIVAVYSHLRAREHSAGKLLAAVEVPAAPAVTAVLPFSPRSIALYRLAPKSGPPQAS